MPRKTKATIATGEGESPTGLTEGELRFIKAIFDNMTQKPDANWDKVATDLGLKDAKCAKERFRQMSVRHSWREQPASANATPRKPVKSGAAANAKVTKRAPRTPSKRVKKEETTDDEGDEQELEQERVEKQEGSGDEDGADA
jgi:hypothetical protein